MAETQPPQAPYRGRIAPTPTGLLHLGHAQTFWTAFRRAKAAGGTLILRNEDLDPDRCKTEFVDAFVQDLKWLGISWQEGPDIGGPSTPYTQSERTHQYLQAWQKLKDTNKIYPCKKSRKDLREAVTAPHAEDEEPIFPSEWRPPVGTGQEMSMPGDVNWRFRVDDNEMVAFYDLNQGKISYQAGKDFGDFLIWRRDGVPAYELAVVVDDIAMGITEVVRGEDLLKSTARQLLLYRALGAHSVPAFYHCPLVLDEQGKRLAKRSDSLSIRALRESGKSPLNLLN